ncbi:MAG: hypothetical protein V1804_00055 [Patescibacteria group bacterium]
MENKPISMLEASRLCSYSQEYLSLLARQGKLQSKKIGKRWFTTEEAVSEYLKEKRPGEKIADYRKELLAPKKVKFNYSWLIFGVSLLFITVFLFIYQNMESKISQLEIKTAQMEYPQKNMVYPFNLPGYADFFSPEKLEF